MSRPHFAPVLPLPLCGWCRHTWSAHWSDEGCQAPTGPDSVCGCPEIPPDDPEHPDDATPDEDGEEEQAA